MLVIPVKDGVQNIPVVTLSLILISCLVFFTFQLNENAGYDDAVAFSQASGLLKIEAVAYKDFLRTSNQELPAEFQASQNSKSFVRHMMQDDQFQKELNDHALITPSSTGYAHWLELRQIFEADLNRVFSRNYGYSPVQKNYKALFTSMFLHGAFLTLLVNMVLLWFVGSLLESSVGRTYFAGYVFAGFCGSFLFGLIFSNAGGPLVGSAAALAGLMGAYGIIFSRDKLRAINSVGFSFDYANVPGWFLLPFWLVAEIVLLVTGAGANGTYVAHIGGLLAGLGLGLGYLAKGDEIRNLSLSEVKANGGTKVDSLLEKVEWQLAVQRFGEARETVFKLLKLEPTNIPAMTHLFNIDKQKPESVEFHETASLFLGHLATVKGSYEIEKYFEEYLALCPSAKVQPAILLGAATSYIHTGKTEPASKLLALLLKVEPEISGLPSCLFNLAQMYRAGDQQKQWKKCLRILVAHYPETNSGRKAKEFLSPQLHHTFGNEDDVE